MTIEERAKHCAASIIEWCFSEESEDENFATHEIERVIREQQEIDERLIAQAKEDGELLAYNCEKKGRREMLDKACEVVKKMLSNMSIKYGDKEIKIKAEINEESFRKEVEKV